MHKAIKKKSVVAAAKSWATKNKLFGTQAFLRYVIFRFVECLNQHSDQFTFKGGNLLWVYIRTPRGTIDLDLSSASAFSEVQVRNQFERANQISDDIQFQILAYKKSIKNSKTGAALTIGFKTEEGASNQFEIDLVFSSDDDTHEMTSPIDQKLKIKCVSMENIIADKLSACHQFGSGNTRMKDFDDLWRIIQSDVKINQKKLTKLIQNKELNRLLNHEWISKEMNAAWSSHRKRYKDLPDDLGNLFNEINEWLIK
jgi:hypothetical protein